MNLRDDSQFPFETVNSTHFTKQRLLKIHEIYEFCNSAQGNSDIREVINARFAKIAEQAEQHICDFANGKLTIDNDALDLMKAYIDEFGRNYYRHDGKMMYEYSPEASKAKIKLEKMAYQAAQKAKVSAASDIQVAYNLDVLSAGTADEFVGDDSSQTVSPASKSKSQSHPSPTTVYENLERQEKQTSPKEIFSSVAPQKQSQAAKIQITAVKKEKKKSNSFFKKLTSKAHHICSETVSSIHQSIKRYGMAAVALFSSSGAYNSYTMANNESNYPTYKVKPLTMPDLKPVKTLDLSFAATHTNTENSEYRRKESLLPAENPMLFGSLLEQTPAQGLVSQNSPTAETESSVTLADLCYTDYKFTAEDLEAMLPSETARKLAEKAQEIAQKMNCENYCFRGVKRAFRSAGLGEMYGRSAYMAKKQLDNNPHFVRINCDIQNTDKLPNGGIAVYGKSAHHPHGHIGVYHDGKDCSSKIRKAISATGSYNGVDIYLPADIKVPQQVLEKINGIMVLKSPVHKQIQTAPVVPGSAFVLAMRNMKTNG